MIAGRPDAAVVDLRVDDGLADSVLDWLSKNRNFRALVVTNVDQVDARLRALTLGATDHLIAPFEQREILARVRHLIALRRSARCRRLQIGDLTIDAAQRCVVRNGATIALTPREVDVLRMLVENGEQLLSKQEILNAVWHGESRSENVVEANVSSLRRKLHAHGPPVIHTLHRSGYVFRPVPATQPAR